MDREGGKWSLFLVNQVGTVNRWIVIPHWANNFGQKPVKNSVNGMDTGESFNILETLNQFEFRGVRIYRGEAERCLTFLDWKNSL